MLDTFSKDIVYKELPPPYTQTLFIELIRFIPGQPDTVLANGSSSHASSSSSSSHSPHHAPNGNSFGSRALPHPTSRATSHSFSPPNQINPPSGHIPPPPPWEVKWRRTVATPSSSSSSPALAAPPSAPVVIAAPSPLASSSSARRLSTSSTVVPPLPAPAAVADDKRLPLPMTPPSASRKRKYPEGDATPG